MTAAAKVVYTSAVAAELGELPGEPVGIGLCDALLGTASLISRHRPDLVVFVGTAGVFPKWVKARRALLPKGGGARPEGGTFAVGGVVQAGSAILGDAALALGLGYAPRHPGPITTVPLASIRSVTVVTNLAVTTDTGLADRHAGAAQVENMEAYGVALACTRAGVRWACVLGITNLVGPGAHEQWLANRSGCEAAAREAAVLGTAGALLPLPHLS